MEIKRTVFEADLINVLNSNNARTRWWRANEILYNLCSDNNQYEADFFVVKLWLIGRSYAAAVERRKLVRIDIVNDNDFCRHNYDFYYDSVWPLLSENNFLQNEMNRLEQIDNIDGNINTILEVHKNICDKLSTITGKVNKSLVSKYLHFHFPNLYFIYDSRASTEIKKYVIGNIPSIDNYDDDYYKFYMKCYELYREYNNEYCNIRNNDITRYFTRLLDTILLIKSAESSALKREYLHDELLNNDHDFSKENTINNAIEVYKDARYQDIFISELRERNNSNLCKLEEKINSRFNINNNEDDA